MNINNLLQNIQLDSQKNQACLHLTANENQMSNTARMFLNDKIGERYYFGGGDQNSIVNFGSFTLLGYKGIENLIYQAHRSAKKMLYASAVNLNLLSGVHAMMSAILAVTNPGDTIMTVTLEAGGHFATKGIIERTGRKHLFLDFNFDLLTFDTKSIAHSCEVNHTKAIYLDVSYYLNPHNLRQLRRAVGKNIIIIYDASHTLGLIMGHQFQNPLKEGADIICANTHKTFPGPHKGLIAFKDRKLAETANKIIGESLYSTVHTSHLIALSITILEMARFGKSYAKQIIKNANALGKAFSRLGYKVGLANTGRYTQNHQIHVYLNPSQPHLILYQRLLDNNISTNFQGEEFSRGRWFMRLGTAEITRKGMKEAEMSLIAQIIDRALAGENVRENVRQLNTQFPHIHYSFDQS